MGRERFADFDELLNEYENIRDLEAVAFDRAWTFPAVWDSRRVAHVKNLLVRQELAQLAYHRQPANARIEDADRLRRLRAGFIHRH